MDSTAMYLIFFAIVIFCNLITPGLQELLKNFFSKRVLVKKEIDSRKYIIAMERRFDCVEKIFFSLSQAYALANTNAPLDDVQGILESISKSKISRALYFSQKENAYIDEIAGDILSLCEDVCQLTDIPGKFEILREMLCVSYAMQS